MSQAKTKTKTKAKSVRSVRMLCEGALMIALAMILNQLKLYQFPNGGSITLEMLPIFIFALRWGVSPGLLVGFAFGLLQMFYDGAIAWGWQSLLLDYLVAFTPLGLAGIGKGKGAVGLYGGVILGAFVRFVVHFISGITIYAIVAPTELFAITFTSPWMYSLAYNGSYMLIDTALCVIVFVVLGNTPLKRYLYGQDLAA
jgi:thiamine transporter